MVLRDDQVVVDDGGREQHGQTEIGLSGLPAKPRKRRSNPDERLSVGTIAATMAAVIVVGFAFTAFLPSIFTRDGVESTATPTTPPAPVQPAQTEQFGAMQPVVAPARAPAPAPPDPELHPESYKAWSLTNFVPVLNNPGSVPSAKPAADRTAGAEVPFPSAGKGAATSRTDLTAAEKAAVDRGLKDLRNTTAINAPRRSAPPRSTLTDEEKAAIERGLRELEKEAGQAKQ